MMSPSKIIIALILIVGLILGVCFWPPSSSVSSLPKEVIEEVVEESPIEEVAPVVTEEPVETIQAISSSSADQALPEEVDLISQLFSTKAPLLPIVETVTFVSRVPWLTNRPAYLGDWALHFGTSKHFISRSLKGAPSYFHENVSRGDRFNVFRKDKQIEFHLVVDLSRNKTWLYYFDKQENQRQLLKSYPVCVGKIATDRTSGSLTPLGLFEIGKEIAIYKEGDMGLYKNDPCEMITVFGQRWIPFSREIADCSGPCKGLGLQGMPWVKDPVTGQLVEKRESIGSYDTLGSVRFLTEDIQEIFSIIISKPSYVHIVKDFQDAKLPGIEGHS